MINWIIVSFLSNFTVSCLIMGVIASFIAIACKSHAKTSPCWVEALFRYFLLFSVGVSFLYNAIIHIFFGHFAAAFIGWSQSPFQLEVGFANLGVAICGLIAWLAPLGFRAATVTMMSVFLWGAAGGHIYQMITAGNFAPGNAGSVFWTDIFVPIIAYALLFLSYRFPIERRYYN